MMAKLPLRNPLRTTASPPTSNTAAIVKVSQASNGMARSPLD
jgi:hypothetical protein